jgi:hypothetical protein
MYLNILESLENKKNGRVYWCCITLMIKPWQPCLAAIEPMQITNVGFDKN